MTFQYAQNAFDAVFADTKAPIVLQVSRTDSRKMPKVELLRSFMDSITQVIPSVPVNDVSTYDKVVLRIAYEKAIRYAVTPGQITDRIVAILKSQAIADFQVSESAIPVVVIGEQPSTIYDLLNKVFISNKHQEQIPLSAVVTLTRENEYKNIMAGIGGEYYPVDIHTDQVEKDLPEIEKVVKAFADRLDIQLDGSYFMNRQLLSDMALILAISVLLLYFILAAQFESFIQPLFILVELPIAIAGAFLFLYIGNSSLNLMSMIGIVVMSGLVINDSILKIDAINQLRNKGVPVMQAIFEGGHKRLRSIVMISLTSIGALMPTLFMDDLGSELQKPLALALIGGMVVGLFVSLFFVPIIYWKIYARNEKN